MKRRFDKYFPWVFTLIDFLVSLVALLICDYGLQFIGIFEGASFLAFVPLSVLWMLVSVLRKDFKIPRTDEYEHTLRRHLGTVGWFTGATAILWLPFRTPALQVIPVLALGFGMLVIMGMFRVTVHMILRKYRTKGNNYRNAVIVGKGGTGRKLADVLKIRKDFGINFLGYFDDKSNCAQTRGKIKDFFERAAEMDLDMIYIHEKLDSDLVKRVIDFADEHYIQVKMLPGGSLQLEKSLSFSKYGNLFVINVNEIPLDHFFNRFAKRAFDVIFAVVVIVCFLSLLIPILGILIKLESKGPIFFIQKRNGVNNKVFNCIKFRSMTVTDREDGDPENDHNSRITKIGLFMRESSLDEVPQFINVLLGHMSVVGPRPHTVSMNKELNTQIMGYNSRHKVRPGITGLAQVRGYRGKIETPQQIRNRVRLDSFYIHRWSFMLDLEIMGNTFGVLSNKEDGD
ncbi:exopolysaccharide biosynthesis polyprenyl glycosylphosphotransferase [Algoriphagus halophytocola]|uniref:Exopolysaccharide biosynthesis polyprenyl glycosylphosphotransferase n=1 Tax=Algoriphagus halophytocola TaxID=2991499 RepID=A0ABY6MDA5_9BACT|nr:MULTISPECIES: exopolysaccharide biosynthesis polyprenyl glycosylphosphotransferase [unclassified Algoriphagus]UZD21726.1 exopolysaccharide biosynthesis polyprenyl glycosylphosphotransferase [Algoriphagus sp. TR-M5]WBL42938.1 exopolysaccharide biosynthesis polyprenyl glycosylphosphotransferase [Algoriphagus sp. TR-M9]